MVFDFFLAGSVLSVIAIGHFGLWIWLYNRINATGFNRKTIKRTEKAIVLICGVIPIALILLELRTDVAPYRGMRGTELSTMLNTFSFLTKAYCMAVTVFAVVSAPFWIADRPLFATAKDRFELLEVEDLKQLQHPESNANLYIQGARFRKMAKLPGNQIVSVQRNRKRLLIDGLPKELEGLKIAHLSDVHLTGQLSTRFYRLVIDWMIEQSPDIVVISGDIVDYEKALPQLPLVLQGVSAPLGCYFVLGNHDKRLPRPTDVCNQLNDLGWIDLGVSDAIVKQGGIAIQLVGNELPWFRRHTQKAASHWTASDQSAEHYFRLGISHSPDQFAWGVESKCSLLLCGHTHGGQISLPFLGPIIAPSWYGARYASGVFARNATLMHVSRGVSGVHPFRWGCLPEASILELAATGVRHEY